MSIEPFLNYLKDEKRYSSLTLLAYKKDLEQFFKILGKIISNAESLSAN